MASSQEHRPVDDGVRYTYEDNLVTAIDIGSGVAASGHSQAEALGELSDALALHEGDGAPIEDEDAFLREIGIDPSDAEQDCTPPWLE